MLSDATNNGVVHSHQRTYRWELRRGVWSCSLQPSRIRQIKEAGKSVGAMLRRTAAVLSFFFFFGSNAFSSIGRAFLESITSRAGLASSSSRSPREILGREFCV
jgi:hypothetical protein